MIKNVHVRSYTIFSTLREHILQSPLVEESLSMHNSQQLNIIMFYSLENVHSRISLDSRESL